MLSAIVLVGAFCLAAPVLCLPAAAQEDSASIGPPGASTIGPTRYDNIGWHKVVFLNFDSEAARRAKALTKRCLASSGARAGASMPLVLETLRGPWDLVMIYPLDGAPSKKRWETPADLEVLQAACTHAVGGDAWRGYKALIVRSAALVGLSGRLGRPPGGS